MKSLFSYAVFMMTEMAYEFWKWSFKYAYNNVVHTQKCTHIYMYVPDNQT